MGYVKRNTRQDWLIADFETTAREDLDQFADDMKIDRRLTDPAKIAEARAKRMELAATDIDYARIGAVGLWSFDEDAPTVWTGNTETAERSMVETFWRAYQDIVVDRGGVLVGFNHSTYDVPLAMTRAQILDVPYSRVDLYRYAKGGPLLDVLRVLTHDWTVDRDKWKKLDVYARLRGIYIPDPTITLPDGSVRPLTGADMPGLITAGDFEPVRAHCLADLQRTYALASRLSLIGPAAGMGTDTRVVA